MSKVIEIGNEKLLIPEKSDPCPLWVSFFNALKKKVGRDSAREIWLYVWNENGATFCTTNQEFNRWMKKNKIDVSNAYTRSLATTLNIGSNTLGLLDNSMTFLKYAIPLVAFGVLYYTFKIVGNTVKDTNIKDVAGMIPQTKALKLL